MPWLEPGCGRSASTTSATPSAHARRAATAPPADDQERMGHRDYKTTSLYADYAPDSTQGAAWAQRAFGEDPSLAPEVAA